MFICRYAQLLFREIAPAWRRFPIAQNAVVFNEHPAFFFLRAQRARACSYKAGGPGSRSGDLANPCT